MYNEGQFVAFTERGLPFFGKIIQILKGKGGIKIYSVRVRQGFLKETLEEKIVRGATHAECCAWMDLHE
jgi:hypothetical protein